MTLYWMPTLTCPFRLTNCPMPYAHPSATANLVSLSFYCVQCLLISAELLTLSPPPSPSPMLTHVCTTPTHFIALILAVCLYMVLCSSNPVHYFDFEIYYQWLSIITVTVAVLPAIAIVARSHSIILTYWTFIRQKTKLGVTFQRMSFCSNGCHNEDHQMMVCFAHIYTSSSPLSALRQGT